MPRRCIKGIVFATFWQAVAVALAFRLGAGVQLPRAEGDTPALAATRLTNFVTCVEMLLFACAHSYAFSAAEYWRRSDDERAAAAAAATAAAAAAASSSSSSSRPPRPVVAVLFPPSLLLDFSDLWGEVASTARLCCAAVVSGLSHAANAASSAVERAVTRICDDGDCDGGGSTLACEAEQMRDVRSTEERDSAPLLLAPAHLETG